MNTNTGNTYVLVAVEKHNEFADHRNMWYFSSKCTVGSTWNDEESAKKALEQCRDSDRTLKDRPYNGTLVSMWGRTEATETLHVRHYIVPAHKLAQFIVENSYSDRPQYSDSEIRYMRQRIFGPPSSQHEWGSGDGNPND